MRIAILGNSGSGKSTLARWLAERMGSAGPKLELAVQPELEPPTQELLAFLS